MAKDVRGISRVNLFEQMPASNGVTYSALRGSDGSEVTTPNYRMSGDEIQRYAASAAETPYYTTHGRVR